MTRAERDRLCVVRATSEGRLTRKEAAERLEVTTRQVLRLVRTFQKRGDWVAIHGHRDKPGNRGAKGRKLRLREQAEALFTERYDDYGPVLLAETLAAQHGLCVPRETLRRWLGDSDLREAKRKVRVRHPRRPRRQKRGELLQLDTSIHRWFEGRSGSEVAVLVAAIDDATGEVFGRFYGGDTVPGNQEVLRRWIERNGRPEAVYVDRHTHFAGMPSEEELDRRYETQIGRMLDDLGIELILARSPQAKGRVERTFRTHQDRLVKKLRERGISTIKAANDYLESDYWNEHNRRFARPAADARDAHRKLTNRQRLFFDAICSVREDRTLCAGDIVKVDGRELRVRVGRRGPRRGATIEVVREASGAIRLYHKEREFLFEDVTETRGERREERRIATEVARRRTRVVARLERAGHAPQDLERVTLRELEALMPVHKPSPDHPWRGSFKRPRPGAIAPAH